MKKSAILFRFLIVAISSLLVFTNCKKRQAFNSEDGQSSVDTRNAQGENDAAISDVNTVVGDVSALRGKGNSETSVSAVLGTSICGLTIDTAGIKQGILILNYNGTVCNNRKREGSIKLSVMDFAVKKWKQKGCVIKVEFIGYKITRASDGKSVQLDGTQYLSNESGGTWFELLFLNQPSIVNTITGNDLNVKFDGSKTAVYNINRRFTYTWDKASSVLTCVGEGIGSHDGKSSLENWGKTRDGDDFTSEVSTPIVWNTTCGAGAPIQGEVHIKVATKDFELKCLFAVDAKGNSVAVAANSCAFGFKVEWTYKGKTKNRIFGYN
jgi:hypothetical protein